MRISKISILIVFLFCGQHAWSQIAGFYDGKMQEIKTTSTKKTSQKSTFLSFSFGPSNYLGDLGGNSGKGHKFIRDNNFKQKTFMYGVSLSRIWKEAIGYRLSYVNGNIAGSDQDAEYKNKEDAAYNRFKRNLDFKSKIVEGSLLVEMYPFKFIPSRCKLHQWNFQPYLLFGIGIFSFNPQGSYYDDIVEDNVWVDLPPLHTEGQGFAEYESRKTYALTQTNLPYGIGFVYPLGIKTSLAFEFVGRKLHTDYLDDVSTTYIDASLFDTYLNTEDAQLAKMVYNKSNLIDPDNPFTTNQQRGNPSNNDFYYSFNVKFSIQINKAKSTAAHTQFKYDDMELCY